MQEQQQPQPDPLHRGSWSQRNWPWIVGNAMISAVLIYVFAIGFKKTDYDDELNSYIRKQQDSLTKANQELKETNINLGSRVEQLTDRQKELREELDKTKNSQREIIITRWRDLSAFEFERYITDRYPDSTIAPFKAGNDRGRP